MGEGRSDAPKNRVSTHCCSLCAWRSSHSLLLGHPAPPKACGAVTPAPPSPGPLLPAMAVEAVLEVLAPGAALKGALQAAPRPTSGTKAAAAAAREAPRRRRGGKGGMERSDTAFLQGEPRGGCGCWAPAPLRPRPSGATGCKSCLPVSHPSSRPHRSAGQGSKLVVPPLQLTHRCIYTCRCCAECDCRGVRGACPPPAAVGLATWCPYYAAATEGPPQLYRWHEAPAVLRFNPFIRRCAAALCSSFSLVLASKRVSAALKMSTRPGSTGFAGH